VSRLLNPLHDDRIIVVHGPTRTGKSAMVCAANAQYAATARPHVQPLLALDLETAWSDPAVDPLSWPRGYVRHKPT